MNTKTSRTTTPSFSISSFILHPSSFLILLLLAFLLLPHFCFAANGSHTSTGFTQADRERLIRLEATLETFMKATDDRFKAVDKRFEDINRRFEDINRRFEELREDMNKRFEQMYSFLEVICYTFAAIAIANFGFVFWDRRTLLRPLKQKVNKLEETCVTREEFTSIKQQLATVQTRLKNLEELYNNNTVSSNHQTATI
jgi:chaperonin cofactor prefoldin